MNGLHILYAAQLHNRKHLKLKYSKISRWFVGTFNLNGKYTYMGLFVELIRQEYSAFFVYPS